VRNPAPPFASGTPLGTFTFLRTDTPTDVTRAADRNQVARVQSFPNPAPTIVTVEYFLQRAGHASLVIYDVAGRHVRTLQEGPSAAGVHQVTWDRRTPSGALVPAGIYIYELRTTESRIAKRLTLLP